jgi:hypothetical protein
VGDGTGDGCGATEDLADTPAEKIPDDGAPCFSRHRDAEARPLAIGWPREDDSQPAGLSSARIVDAREL